MQQPKGKWKLVHHARDVGCAEKGSLQGDVKNIGTEISALGIPIASKWRMWRDEFRPKALITCYMDMEKNKPFLSILNFNYTC